MKSTHFTLAAFALASTTAFAVSAYAQAPATPPAAAAPAAPAAPAPVRPPVEDPKVKLFAQLPTADAPENICQQTDGTIYVTLLDARKLMKISADGKTVTEFYSDPKMADFVGVACGDNEIAMVAYEKNFRGAPAVPATATTPAIPAGPLDFADVGSHIYVFDLTGKMVSDIKAPAGHGLNGLSYTGTPGMYYASNSAAGGIDKIDTKAKTITEWYNDPTYGPTAALAIGINGLKYKNGWIYFAGVPTKGLYKIQVGADGKPAGKPVKIEEGLTPDDFDVANNGDVYFPVGTTLYKAPAAGGDPVKAADPVQGGATALVTRDQKLVIWPTRNGTDPQRLLELPIS